MPKIAYIEKKFKPESLALIEKINGVINEYSRQGFSLTLRQVYYQMVARAIIPNSERSYNRDVLEPLSEWWWTLTRWSASNSCYVRGVNSDGTLHNHYACNGDRGLRPALLLASDLLISVDEPGEDTSAEDKLTPEEAGEIMRDMANTFGVPGGVTSDELAAGVAFLRGMLRGDVDLRDREAPRE